MKNVAPLLRYLRARDHISREEARTVENLPWRVKTFSHNEVVIRQGSVVEESCLLMDGFAARSEAMAEGTRQITAIHIPGDFLDLHSFLLKVMDHDVVAVKNCTAGFVAHTALKELTEEQPHLARVLLLSIAIDGAIQRSWIVSMGRRSAKEQLAHFVCELFLRLTVVGMTAENSFEIPFTQENVADMMGFSTVHTNRMLQALRGENLISWESSTVTIHDWDRLSRLAEFNAAYLNLEQRPR